jgi:hypothetical protein
MSIIFITFTITVSIMSATSLHHQPTAPYYSHSHLLLLIALSLLLVPPFFFLLFTLFFEERFSTTSNVEEELKVAGLEDSLSKILIGDMKF